MIVLTVLFDYSAKVLEYETSKDTIAKWRRSFKECMVKKQVGL